MKDYTLTELAHISHKEIEEQLILRKKNLLEIDNTIEKLPNSPHNKGRLYARIEELYAIVVLETIQEYKSKAK